MTPNELGKAFVTAELYRRGVQAVEPALRGKKEIFRIKTASDDATFEVYIKALRNGKTWQASIDDGAASEEPAKEISFWVFVDIRQELDHPEYFIIPEWWIRNNIFEVHQAYLARHGGQRKHGGGSTHHSIEVERVEQWTQIRQAKRAAYHDQNKPTGRCLLQTIHRRAIRTGS